MSAFIKEKQGERFQNYIADAGYLMVNGYYTRCGAQAPFTQRFAEPPKPKKKQETADEIISRIRNGLKGL